MTAPDLPTAGTDVPDETVLRFVNTYEDISGGSGFLFVPAVAAALAAVGLADPTAGTKETPYDAAQARMQAQQAALVAEAERTALAEREAAQQDVWVPTAGTVLGEADAVGWVPAWPPLTSVGAWTFAGVRRTKADAEAVVGRSPNLIVGVVLPVFEPDAFVGALSSAREAGRKEGAAERTTQIVTELRDRDHPEAAFFALYIERAWTTHDRAARAVDDLVDAATMSTHVDDGEPGERPLIVREVLTAAQEAGRAEGAAAERERGRTEADELRRTIRLLNAARFADDEDPS